MNTATTQQQDFDVGTLYAGRYLKADDLNGVTYAATIAAVERVEMPEQDGSIRLRAALTLQGWPAKLLLNKTNFEAIAAAYGRQSAGWLGKPLEVYPDTTLFGGRLVACVRVRVPRPATPSVAFPDTTLPGTPPAAPPAPIVPLAAAAPPAPTTADAADPEHGTPTPPTVTGDFGNDIPY